eukprot:scaffold166509_cov52-Prasinocladus_malaysianus.AAC.2
MALVWQQRPTMSMPAMVAYAQPHTLGRPVTAASSRPASMPTNPPTNLANSRGRRSRRRHVISDVSRWGHLYV